MTSIAVIISVILSYVDVFVSGSFLMHQPNFFLLLSNLTLINRCWVIDASVGIIYGGAVWYVNGLFLCYVIYWIINYIHRHTIIKNTFLYFMFIFIGMYLVYDWKVVGMFLYPDNGVGYVSFFIGVLLSRIYIKDTLSLKFVRINFGICIVLMVLSAIFGLGTVIGIDRPQRLVWYMYLFPVTVYSFLKLPLIKRIVLCKCFKRLYKYSNALFFSHSNVLLGIALVDIGCGNIVKWGTVFTFFIHMGVIIIAALLWYYFIEKNIKGIFMMLKRICFN